MAEILIVTKHDGVVEWLKEEGITGKVLANASPEDVIGKHVYGKLPLRLAALASSYSTISMHFPIGSNNPMSKSLSAEEMDSFDAYLEHYTISRLFNSDVL